MGPYEGRLTLAHADVDSRPLQGALRGLSGDIRIQGQRLMSALEKGAGSPPPVITGHLQVKDGHYLLATGAATGLTLSRIRGKALFQPSGVTVPHLEAVMGHGGSDARLTAQGWFSPDFRQYRAHLTGHGLRVPDLYRNALGHLPTLRHDARLAALHPTDGQLDINVTVSTGGVFNGNVTMTAFEAQTEPHSHPIRIPRLVTTLNNQRVTLHPTTLYYGPLEARLSGHADTSGAVALALQTEDIPMSLLRDAQGWIRRISDAPLPEIWNTAGSFRVDGTLANGVSNLRLHFNQAGLSWQGGDFPLYDMNGHLFYKRIGRGEDVLGTRAFSFRYGNSPITVKAGQSEHFRMRVEGVLSDLLVNHFLVSPQSNATPYREIPFQLRAGGILQGLPGSREGEKNRITTRLHLDLNPTIKDAYDDRLPTPPHLAVSGESSGKTSEKAAGETINRRGSRALPGDVSSGSAPEEDRRNYPLPQGEQTASTEDDNAFLNARITLSGNNLLLERGVAHLFEAGNIFLEGAVQDIFHPDRRIAGLHTFTQPAIHLEKLSHSSRNNDFFRGSRGSVAWDLSLNGGRKLETLQGWVESRQVAIPYLTLEELTGRAGFFGGARAGVEVETFRIPGVEAGATAVTETLTELPVTLEDVQISGRMLNIEALEQFSTHIVTPIIIEQLIHNFARPWQQGDPRIPIQFRNADLHFDEAVLQNILMSNLDSKLSVYANSFFELTDARLNAADGDVNGYFSINPNENNFMTLELNANHVKANALTRALLGVTNQVFGDLSGTVRFTTFGGNDVELQDNANGTVRMKIINGRLPAIAKVETLLATANLLRGGLLGFNLNNLFRSLMFYHSDYFAELSGDLLIANGVLYTDNLTSDGENLDFVVRGTVDMGSGDADMQVDGRMRQDVAGKLGLLGRLSLGSFLRFIPGLGTFGPNQPGLLGYLPGIGFTPGFGGPAAGHFNHFQARLVGSLDHPSAVRDFRWIRKGD